MSEDESLRIKVSSLRKRAKKADNAFKKAYEHIWRGM